jgi:hypothetical protein
VRGPAHAVVVRVALEPATDPMHRLRILDEFVIPELRGLPGYRNSLWLTDGVSTGTCIVVFDDAARAQAGLEVLTREGGPPTLAAAIHEVEAEDPAPGPP